VKGKGVRSTANLADGKADILFSMGTCFCQISHRY